MRAMILAAGRGERMRPLTDTTPKPLLRAGDKPLIGWHLQRLAQAGYSDVVINTAWLGEQLRERYGNGQSMGLRLHWSPEARALETAGGVATAMARVLPELRLHPFLVMSGDIWSTWPVQRATAKAQHMAAALADPSKSAAEQAHAPLMHLVMVPNPDYHPDGDFDRDSLLWPGEDLSDVPARVTFGNIGIYAPAVFKGLNADEFVKLGPLIREAIAQRRVTAEFWRGRWHNVGTPADLQRLDDELRTEQRTDIRTEPSTPSRQPGS